MFVVFIHIKFLCIIFSQLMQCLNIFCLSNTLPRTSAGLFPIITWYENTWHLTNVSFHKKKEKKSWKTACKERTARKKH